MNKDNSILKYFFSQSKDSNYCLWKDNSPVVKEEDWLEVKQFVDLLFFPKRKEAKSIGSAFNSMASTAFYNVFTKQKKLDLAKHSKVNIYDKAYSGKDKSLNVLLSLNSVLLMTYRNGMNSINTQKDIFNTDCGWGCTLRACQMMMAKALIELKKCFFKEEKDKEAQYMNVMSFREETIALMADNNLPIDLALKLRDFDWLFDVIKCFYHDKDMKPLDLRNDVGAQRNYEINAPFSIRTICRFTESAGQWASAGVIIGALMMIAEVALCDIKLIYSSSGTVYEEEIYNAFCEEVHCSCDKTFQLLDGDNDQCDVCALLKQDNNKESDLLIYNKPNKAKDQPPIRVIYRFKWKGIIFVTVRLGLRLMESEYVEDVKKLFAVPNNLGFIGGKDNRAFYFIGHTNDFFICLDPHLNQDAIQIFDKDFLSYKVTDLYTVKPSDMSPEITFGFLFTKGDDIVKCLLSLKQIHKGFLCIK